MVLTNPYVIGKICNLRQKPTRLAKILYLNRKFNAWCEVFKGGNNDVAGVAEELAGLGAHRAALSLAAIQTFL